ncbi:hypothetical protein [Helicobacter himalayensis]|uniref:hypothetical protein n=1 Tax=Helicobacter himalayensis TaxID=1591088 RepID=UPI000A52A182|nr:hypothetical protein [Helicobacter himalayensis]
MERVAEYARERRRSGIYSREAIQSKIDSNQPNSVAESTDSINQKTRRVCTRAETKRDLLPRGDTI